MSRQRVLGRTTKTGVRDFCDTSDPLAGPDRSQVATTERRIGRKTRKFRDQFESMPCPEKPFYNNYLLMAVQGVSSEPVSVFGPKITCYCGFLMYLGLLRPRSCRFFVMIQRFNSFAGAIGNT